MAVPTRIEGDVYVNGSLSSKTITLPASAVGDAQVQASAGINATKVQHQHRKGLAQESATTAAAETRVVHVAAAVGTLTRFEAGVVVPPSNGGGDDRTVTFDLKVNGSSVLSATIVIDKTNTARQVETATISSPDLVAGDVVEIAITVGGSTGTQAKGAFAQVTVNELPQ